MRLQSVYSYGIIKEKGGEGMRKYCSSFFRFFLIYVFGFLAFTAASFLVSVFYNVLNGALPSVFPRYNFVTEPELAESLAEGLRLTSGILSVFLLELLAVKYDNSRYEYLISRTDGFYTLKEGAVIYVKGYLFADVASAVLVPLTTYSLVFINIGDKAPRILRMLEKPLNTFISIPLSFTEKFGLTVGALLLIAVSLLSRAASAYFGIKRWRAIWLSDIRQL